MVNPQVNDASMSVAESGFHQPRLSPDATCLILPDATAKAGIGGFQITIRENVFQLPYQAIREVRDGAHDLVWINRRSQADQPNFSNAPYPEVSGEVYIFLYGDADIAKIKDVAKIR